MSIEGFGNKIFYYTALARLKTLQIYPLYNDVDELRLMEILRTDIHLWTSVQVHREQILNDAGLVAEYELKMLDEFNKSGGWSNIWEWGGLPGSLGMAFINMPVWKQSGTFIVKSVIIKTGQNEWRTYKVEPINP